MNLKAFASARASLYKAGVLAPHDPLIRAVAPSTPNPTKIRNPNPKPLHSNPQPLHLETLTHNPYTLGTLAPRPAHPRGFEALTHNPYTNPEP